jgi:hypothetical protein
LIEILICVHSIKMFVRVIDGESTLSSAIPDKQYYADVQMQAIDLVKAMTAEDSGAPISEQTFVGILAGAFSSNMSPVTVRSDSVRTPSPGAQYRGYSAGSIDSFDLKDDESRTSRGSRASVHYSGYEFAKQVHTLAEVFIDQMKKELTQKKNSRSQPQVKLIDSKTEDLIIQGKNSKSYKNRSRWVDESGVGMPVLRIPSSLPAKNFKLIQTLVLRNNSMTVVQASVLKPLENLKTLDISHNNIGDITGRFPKTLTSLDVSYNQLKSLTSICKCKGLIELNATNNFIYVIEALPLKLEKLFLADNLIRDYLSFRMLTFTSDLRELSLSGNPVVEKFKDIRARLNSLFVHLEVYDGEALPRSVNSRIAKKISLRVTSKELGGYIKREERSQQEADAQRYEAHKEILEKKHKAFEDLIKKLREIRGTQKLSRQDVGQSAQRLHRSYSLRRKSINYIGDEGDDDELVLASRSASPSPTIGRSISADTIGSVELPSPQRRNSMTSEEREACLRRISQRRRSASDPSRRRSSSGSSGPVRPGSGLAGLFGTVDSLEPISEAPHQDNASVDSLEEDTRPVPKQSSRSASNDTMTGTSASNRVPSFASSAADAPAQRPESSPEPPAQRSIESPSAQLKSVFNALSVSKSKSPVTDSIDAGAVKRSPSASPEPMYAASTELPSRPQTPQENNELLTFMRPKVASQESIRSPDSVEYQNSRPVSMEIRPEEEKVTITELTSNNLLSYNSSPPQRKVAAPIEPDAVPDETGSVASEITIVTEGGTVKKKKFGLKSAVKMMFARKKTTTPPFSETV